MGLNVLSIDRPRLIGSASHTLAVKPFVKKENDLQVTVKPRKQIDGGVLRGSKLRKT